MHKLSVLNNLEDIRLLRDLYKENYDDDNLIGFHVLDNFLNWFEKEPNIKHVRVYSLNDEWQRCGLYLIVDRYGLFMNSLKAADENLGIALRLLDWSRGYKITALPARQHEIVAAALSELNIDFGEVQLQVYRLPWQNALEFDINCPLNFEFKPLDLKSASIVDSNFYSQQAGSLLYFQRLITLNLSVGVYLRQSDELIAWCTRCSNGFLASLFVKPAYRRCGLAEIIIKHFSRELAQMVVPANTLTAVYIGNKASNNLFSKMGFQSITKVFHMKAFCVPNGMEWPFD